MQIPIIAICVVLLALIGFNYWVYHRILDIEEDQDEVLEILGKVATLLQKQKELFEDLEGAMAEHGERIAKLEETMAEAEELIAVTKELADEQIKSEKEFRDGLKSIIDY